MISCRQKTCNEKCNYFKKKFIFLNKQFFKYFLIKLYCCIGVKYPNIYERSIVKKKTTLLILVFQLKYVP